MLASTEQAYAYVGGSPTNGTDPSGQCGPLCDQIIELVTKLFEGGGEETVARVVEASGDESLAKAIEGTSEATADTTLVLNGADLGKVTDLQINVTQKGLDLIQKHLSRPELDDALSDPANQAMIGRLKSALGSSSSCKISGADANFYLHEISEYTLMNEGLSYPVAHQAALDKYAVSTFSLFHPDVIQELSVWFNEKYFHFWGLQK